MSTEIERKFLVDPKVWETVKTHYFPNGNIVQGYLSLDPFRTVRVRIDTDSAYITIKGPLKNISRAEFEYNIPVADALEMLPLCEGSLIRKTRYGYSNVKMELSIDEFSGDNDGLVLVEVELPNEKAEVKLPYWVGEEVTHDSRYYNSNLAINPYKDWKDG